MYSHLGFIQIVSTSSNGSLLGFHPFPLLTFLLKSNKEIFIAFFPQVERTSLRGMGKMHT